jgi:hypothetical protein
MIKRPKPIELIELSNNEDKISRIIEIETYMTCMIINNRMNKYQPHTDDDDQILRDEVRSLRVELGILKPN